MQTPSSEIRPVLVFFQSKEDLDRMAIALDGYKSHTTKKVELPYTRHPTFPLVLEMNLTESQVWDFANCPGVVGVGETADTKARYLNERLANPVDQNNPHVIAFQEHLFPKLFEVEHGVGEWVNWRTTAIGFFIGRGLSVKEAVDLGLRLFPNVKSSNYYRSRQQHPAPGLASSH